MWIHCFPLWRKCHSGIAFIHANKQLTSLLIFSCINTKLLFQCFDLDSMNDTSYVVRQQFAYLCGKKETSRCVTDTLSWECYFSPQNSAFFSITMRNPDQHNAFLCQNYRLGAPRRWTETEKQHTMCWTKGARHPRGSWKDAVNPSVQKEFYNLIMESDLDHNRVYGCLENGFGSDVCSDAAKRWPKITATEAKYPLTAHVLTVFSTLWIK